MGIICQGRFSPVEKGGDATAGRLPSVPAYGDSLNTLLSTQTTSLDKCTFVVYKFAHMGYVFYTRRRSHVRSMVAWGNEANRPTG